MLNLWGGLRYAVRQFRQSPVFAGAAVLTLALGIGGTTAIFTLIHAVMLRSLPVADPARLYRVGDGDNCCVQGGPQDRWGMFSFPLFERLKAETPEFEELAAFQAGGARLSVRRQGVDTAARPLRSEFVTGNYFSTLGVGAVGGRVMNADDDRAASPPVLVLSYHIWQSRYGADPAVVGSTFVVEGHPFTAIGIAAPGFFGETLRSDPPDVWIPLQQEPLIAGQGSLLRQSVGAWLRVIGRVRPGASIEGMAPRLTEVLRQWIVNDSGYPSNWMADIIPMLPKQMINVVPAGAGVGEMKEEIRSEPADSARRLRVGVADCLRERGEPAARARRGAARTNRRASRRRRLAAADRDASARGKRAARRCRRRGRSVDFSGCGAAASHAGFSKRAIPANQYRALVYRAVVRLRCFAGNRHRVRCRAGMVCHANESG